MEKWQPITVLYRFNHAGGSIVKTIDFSTCGYEISTKGRLKHHNIILAAKLYNKTSIENILIDSDGNRWAFQRHQIVAQIFHPQPDYSNLFIIHLDNQKTNNAPSNLQWVSASEANKHWRSSSAKIGK